jgi:hypothetical protein
MIKADVFLCESENFYKETVRKIAAYECLYEILKRFKEAFYFKIHTMYTTKDDSLEINFKGDFTLTFKRSSNECTAELYSCGNNIDDFKEKFEKLKEIIKQIY